MKTIADMTKDQRDQCRGMWGAPLPEQPDSTGGIMGIIIASGNGTAQLVCATGYLMYKDCTLVSPLPNLLSAWNADGTPIEVDWQYAAYHDYPTGGYCTPEPSEKTSRMPADTTMVRRMIGQWEQVRTEEVLSDARHS